MLPTFIPTAEDFVSGGFLAITTSDSSVSNVNTDKKMLLSATVETRYPCDALWTVDVESIDLTERSLVPVAKNLSPSRNYTLNLLLSAYTLSEGATYRFTLTCNQFVDSIAVVTNSLPRAGYLLSAPHRVLSCSRCFA